MIRKVVSTGMIMMLLAVTAEAKLISTDAVVARYDTVDKRETVRQFLERADVIRQLETMGVSSEAAKLQVAMLTDEELDALSQKIDALPAGGDILGVAVFVFLVLLVTDILGMTKVFPFTKPIR